jgi:hypothetical protein
VQVHAENVTGAAGGKDSVKFSATDAARIRLEDVTIVNEGISSPHFRTDSPQDAEQEGEGEGSAACFWKRAVDRKEACRIVLRGRSEFVARGVQLKGDVEWEVPEGYCMEVRPDLS